MGAPIAATVTVPATSANLGPGFDACGLALALYDDVTARIADDVVVEVVGEGSGEVPNDGSHLIAATLLEVAAQAGAPLPGVRLHCTNRIPHGRGLGSSAAAIVAGVVLGRTLAGLPRDVAAELSWAAAAEGHPDNVAPALLGRYTIAWSNGDAAQSRALAIPVHEDVRAVVFVPEARLATERARSLLPAQVDFGAATFNLGRSALLTAALTAHPELLLEATSDRLHQGARREAYPDSLALVERLRAAGVAAAISGAGPTVLALVAGDAAADDVARESIHGFVAQRLAVDGDGAAVAIVTES